MSKLKPRAERRREARQHRKALEIYGKRGCARCGKEDFHGALPVVDGLGAVCHDCSRPGDSVTAFIAIFDPSRPKEDDRRYFLRNPDASQRIRPAYRGEVEEIRSKTLATSIMVGQTANIVPDGDEILVLQIEPGTRVRWPVMLKGLSQEQQVAVISETITYLTSRAAQCISTWKSLTPEAHAVAEHASTLLGIDAVVGEGKLLDKLIDQGRAMTEARTATRQ